jgi:hypothetical protein
MALGLLLFAAGCGYIDGNPATWRQRCRETYTVEVAGEPRVIHKALVAAFYTYGWGEGATINQEFYEPNATGSFWAYFGNPRDTVGFITDVAPTGNGRTLVTVYPESRFYARKSREWLEKTLKLPMKEGL